VVGEVVAHPRSVNSIPPTPDRWVLRLLPDFGLRAQHRGMQIAGAAVMHAQPRRRRVHVKWWLIGAVGLIFLSGVVYLGGGLYISNEVNQGALDAAMKRTEPANYTYPIRVVAVSSTDAAHGEGSITLRVPLVPDLLLTPGTWGLQARDGGFGQISQIEAQGNGVITRSFHLFDGPPIRAGEDLRIATEAFPQDPIRALGMAYQNVLFTGPLGQYPAWYVEGSSTTWAVMVHGNSLRRTDMLRLMAPIHRAGLPMLVITYRNDPAAPQDPSGLMRYGQAEWKDLQSAVQYAESHGAQHIVLAAVSMGGAIAINFLYKSPLAGDVVATILDSPMLDFSPTVDYAVSQRTVLGVPIPQSLVAVAKWMMSWRYGVDWEALDYLARDAQLRTPILLFQGTADAIVPVQTSSILASDRPDIVTYFLTPGADHVDSWNLDPISYEQRVETFISARVASKPLQNAA
jgi:uncharacterized protein